MCSGQTLKIDKGKPFQPMDVIEVVDDLQSGAP